MRLAVDPARKAADDDEPGGGELPAEHARDARAVRRARPRADDRHRRRRQQLRVRRPRARRAPAAGRGSRAAAAESPCRSAAENRRPRPRDRERTRRRRSRGGRPRSETRPAAARGCPSLRRRPRPRAPPSSGELGRCPIGERLGKVGRIDTSLSASAATVRATRATRARPRAESGSRSVARVSSSLASSVRLGAASLSRSRAATTRVRTGSDASLGPAASSVARGRGTVTTRSKRSRSARESLSRKDAIRCAEHEHSAPGSPRAPQGHRFIVATSWNRAGRVRAPPRGRR